MGWMVNGKATSEGQMRGGGGGVPWGGGGGEF